jgi:hypothetical protein
VDALPAHRHPERIAASSAVRLGGDPARGSVDRARARGGHVSRLGTRTGTMGRAGARSRPQVRARPRRNSGGNSRRSRTVPARSITRCGRADSR